MHTGSVGLLAMIVPLFIALSSKLDPDDRSDSTGMSGKQAMGHYDLILLMSTEYKSIFIFNIN